MFKVFEFTVYKFKIHVQLFKLHAETEARQPANQLCNSHSFSGGVWLQCGIPINVEFRSVVSRKSVWRERKEVQKLETFLRSAIHAQRRPCLVARLPTKEVVYPYTTRLRWPAHQSAGNGQAVDRNLLLYQFRPLSRDH